MSDAFESRLYELHSFEQLITGQASMDDLEFFSKDLIRLRDAWGNGDRDNVKIEFFQIVNAFAVPSLATRRQQINTLSGLFGDVEHFVHGGDLSKADLSKLFKQAWAILSHGDLLRCANDLFAIIKYSEANPNDALTKLAEIEPLVNHFAESLLWALPQLMIPGHEVEHSFQIDSMLTVLMQMRCYSAERRICELVPTRNRDACIELLSMAATYLDKSRQIVTARHMMSTFVELEYLFKSASAISFDEYSLELEKTARKIKLLACDEMIRLDSLCGGVRDQDGSSPKSVDPDDSGGNDPEFTAQVNAIWIELGCKTVRGKAECIEVAEILKKRGISDKSGVNNWRAVQKCRHNQSMRRKRLTQV
ncbi:MAG: hypothetical protein KDA87_11755 [Planctomycetales bacterium]|nr:hypothetical protein [Planctomycetales bacterium]